MNKENFQKILKILTLLPLSTANANSNVDVNLQTGALYFRSEIETSLGLKQISRSYSSRSVDIGWFGQGWKTDLEVDFNLDLVSASKTKLKGVLIKTNQTKTRIISLKTKDIELEFVYEGNQLIKILNHSKLLEEYSYDEFGNLNEVKRYGEFQDKYLMSYNKQTDVVKSIHTPNGCLSQFDYLVHENKNSQKVDIDINQLCPNQSPKVVKLEIQNRKVPGGTVLLEQVRQVRGRTLNDLSRGPSGQFSNLRRP